MIMFSPPLYLRRGNFCVQEIEDHRYLHISFVNWHIFCAFSLDYLDNLCYNDMIV